ncbi:MULTISPECIES: hypothetical protein [Kribbella]|uniref:hypothetical protein n=1 Tax=Kribbella TaxID=182639 RepID=UPI001042AB1A|nr:MULTISPECIES: hypothetical protein [Kribbella]
MRSSGPVAAGICGVAGYDDLPAFASVLSSATIGWSGGRLEYESPARGRLESGETTWTVSRHSMTSTFSTGSAVGEGSGGRSAPGERSLVSEQTAKEHTE